MVGVAILAAVAVFFVVRDQMSRCGEGVTKRGDHDECVGVTDRIGLFNKQLADIETRIVDANSGMRGDDEYFTIAYMIPIPPSGVAAGSANLAALANELRGAYIAQLENNSRYPQLKMRLVVANVGVGSVQWEPVVRQLVALREAQHLVAVAGLGQSTATTKAAIRKLADSGIPTIGAVITSDDLHGGKDGIQHLARVAPTNRDEVGAALAVLDGAANTLLVTDRNPDDHYSSTLAEHFRSLRIADATTKLQLAAPPAREQAQKNLERVSSEKAQSYDSSGPSIATRMREISRDICSGNFTQVYFAGRSGALRDFVVALGTRGCSHRGRVTVLAGDDASQIQPNPTTGVGTFDEAIRTGNVTLAYTGLAHPRQWDAKRGATGAVEFSEFRKAFLVKFRDEALLNDGEAMMGHDAITAATSPMQILHEPGEEVSTRTLINGWHQLNRDSSENPVVGVTGVIRLNEFGNRVNPVIPILCVTPEGHKSIFQPGSAGTCVP